MNSLAHKVVKRGYINEETRGEGDVEEDDHFWAYRALYDNVHATKHFYLINHLASHELFIFVSHTLEFKVCIIVINMSVCS
jgi:hypothetical protein